MKNNIAKRKVQPVKVSVKSNIPLKAPVIKTPVVKASASVAKAVVQPSVVKKQVQSKKPVLIPVPKNAAVKMNVAKKKMAEISPEHESYFVYLRNPLEYRRHLLEGCRKILYCLKSNQKIILIRQKKLEEMDKLKTSVKELMYLNKKFNEKLPKYNTGFLDETPSKDKSRSTQMKSAAARKPAEPRLERTEMDRLEDSLANIEKKLKSLQ